MLQQLDYSQFCFSFLFLFQYSVDLSCSDSLKLSPRVFSSIIPFRVKTFELRHLHLLRVEYMILTEPK